MIKKDKNKIVRSWSGTTDYSRLSNELGILARNDFQRKIAPFLKIVFPDIIEAPDSKHIDNSGIDYVCWSDDYNFPVAVQSKGWEVAAERLGNDQVNQCEKSLLSLEKNTNIRVERYIIVHNRDHRSLKFRRKINDLIAKYEAKDNNIGKIEVWSRREFLNKVFDEVSGRLLNALMNDAQRRLKVGLDLMMAHGAINPITFVPVSSQIARTDQFRLLIDDDVAVNLKDPARLILSEDHGAEIVLLIGEFGFGKSTTVLRALANSSTPILFIHGATFASSLSSTNEFLAKCIEDANVLNELSIENSAVLSLISRSVTKYLLSTKSLDIRLVIDGLDESPLLARRDGFQTLFNWLKDVNVPVVLTMRSEMWHARREAFSVSQYPMSGKDKPRVKKFRLIELMMWEDAQILDLTKQYCQSNIEDVERKRLMSFYDLVKNGKYEEIYGDIPKRPLFLHLVLSSVMVKGLPDLKQGRGRLFRDWILYKVRRDLANPIAVGGKGRVPINPNYSIDETIPVAWKVMVVAASQMLQVQDSQIELLDRCSLDNIMRKMDMTRGDYDDLGLFLNTLLVPVMKGLPYESIMVRFAHRAFQEFFLAWHVLDLRSEEMIDQYPLSVQEWIDTLRFERLL